MGPTGGGPKGVRPTFRAFFSFFSLGRSSRGFVAAGRGHGSSNLRVWAPWGHFLKPQRQNSKKIKK